MIPDTDTKVIARLHPESNGRGLNVYNPYFERMKVNALYTLFQNSDPAPLLDGVRNLSLPGAVVAGTFETDQRLPDLLDEVRPISQKLGTVGVVKNDGGKLIGVYQGGYGLYDSMRSTFGEVAGRKLVIVGAGNVARALLLVLEEMQDMPAEVVIYNRSPDRAERLASEFAFVKEVGSLPDFARSASGEILVNTSKLGSRSTKEPAMEFTHAIVARFEDVADVAFLPLDTPLGQLSRDAGKRFAPGHLMFMLQAKYVLQFVLGHEMDQDVYQEILLDDFAKNW